MVETLTSTYEWKALMSRERGVADEKGAESSKISNEMNARRVDGIGDQ